MDTFIFETNQLLEQLEDIMLQVEQAGDISEEHINEIFRAMHTIKGSAAMMEFDNISTVAHRIEDLFFKIRENNSVGDAFSRVCDIVFEGTDFIKSQMAKIESGEAADESADSLVAKISELLGEMNGAPVEASKETIKDENEDTGFSGIKVLVRFEPDCKMENVRAFSLINELSKHCQNIDSKPRELFEDPTSSDVIAKDGLELYIQTELSRDKLEKILLKQMCVESVSIQSMEAGEKNAPSQNKNDTSAQGKQSSAPAKTVVSKQSLINVNVDKLDALLDFVGEIVIAQSMVIQNPELKGLNLPNFYKSAEQLEKLTKELQDVAMAIRMIPIASAFHKMNRIVRDMSKTLNKDVELVIKGEETEVDKTIIDSLSDPLMHLVRNCMDHGVETPEERVKSGKPSKAKVMLRAYNNGNNVIVTVSDDGKGLDRDKILRKAIEKNLLPSDAQNIPDQKIYECILLPGFSTKEQVTEFSGRGVGMDVVKQNIESIGGSISINSKPGEGTVFTIKIPLTLAIIDGMNIAVGGMSFFIPVASVQEAFRCKTEDIARDPYGKEMISLRGRYYDVIRLHRKLGINTEIENLEDGILLVVENNENTVCLFIDEILGEQQVVIKPLPKYLQSLLGAKSGISGCTILGDGTIGFIINTNEL
ncbi:MAG: chemotaxis protein CheA [Clostridia bacterium]|nr:chemotaxis protein CheA [Clostridia bacterium]